MRWMECGIELVCVLAVATAGCKGEGTKEQEGSSTAAAKAVTKRTKAPEPLTAQQRIDRVRDCWDIFNSGDAAFAGCYAPGATIEIVEGGPESSGAALDVIAAYRAAFPKLQGTPMLTLASGNKVVSLDLMQGMHKGELMGIAPTDKQIGMVVAHVFETDDQGLVTKEWAFIDESTMMGQLGQHEQPHRAAITQPMKLGPTAASTNSETEAANSKVVGQYIAALNEHDAEAIAPLFSEDAELIGASSPKDARGADAAVASAASYIAMFPDLKCETNWTIAAGDYVAIQWTCTGTNTAAVKELGIETPTNKAVTLKGLGVSQLADGKIVRDWTFFNSRSMALQLGLIDT